MIERELTRKKYILSLENRTPEQIAEEEALYIEIKRLEQNERKFKKERETLLRTLAGMDSGLPDIVEDDGVSLGITTDGKKKKKGAAMEIDSPATPSTSMAAVVKRPSSAKNAAYGIIVPFLFCSYVLKIRRRCSTLYRSDGCSDFGDCYEGSTPTCLSSFIQITRPKSCYCPQSNTRTIRTGHLTQSAGDAYSRECRSI